MREPCPGVVHDPHVVGPMAAHVILPTIHTVFGNVKSWAKGVYHGLRRPHLQTYLDEFVFRFNRRHTPFAAFRSILRIASSIKPVPYNMLIEPASCAWLHVHGFMCIKNVHKEHRRFGTERRRRGQLG